MLYNLLIGGAAGQGLDTMAAILVKLLKKRRIWICSSYYTRFHVTDSRGP